MKTHVQTAKDTAHRTQEVVGALRKAVLGRGHTAVSDTGAFLINGEQIDWRIYEASVVRKVPLTKKERDDWLNSFIAKRGWRQVLEPGGSLVLAIKAGFHSEIRIVETRKRPLESRIESIVDRLEAIATESAERRAERDEARRRYQERQKRREERLRLEAIEDRKWEAFIELADDWAEAKRLRRFLDRIGKLNEVSPDKSGRLADWLSWAREGVEARDPLSQGLDGFLERLFPPEPSEYELNFGEPEDIDD